MKLQQIYLFLVMVVMFLIVVIFYSKQRETGVNQNFYVQLLNAGIDKGTAIIHDAFGINPANQSEDTGKDKLPQSLMDFARKVNKDGKVLILAVFNEGHVSMANSCLCNTIYMGIHKQVLLVLADTKSRDQLRHHWPQVHVEAIPDEDAENGSFLYGQLGYVKVTLWRNLILHELLKANIELLLVEMDALWLKNPLPDTKRLAQGYDFAAIQTTKSEVAFGYMYIKPTKPILKLWQNFTNIFVSNLEKFNKTKNGKLPTSANINDQVFLSKLLFSGFGGVRLKPLSDSVFLDGRWFFKPNAKSLQNAYILNNNFIKGNDNKINRFKKFNQWFWREDSAQCDLVLVNKTVKY